MKRVGSTKCATYVSCVLFADQMHSERPRVSLQPHRAAEVHPGEEVREAECCSGLQLQPVWTTHRAKLETAVRENLTWRVVIMPEKKQRKITFPILSAAVGFKGGLHPKIKKNSFIVYSPACECEVNKTFLELRSKTELQHSPKQLGSVGMGTCF